jgi:eukaryotic-like serine/threonine-protein kinase
VCSYAPSSTEGPRSAMESGEIIAGKYRLNNLLGKGGMAAVWSATNTFTERQFAIKFMLPSLARTQDAVNRFLQEAKVSARINHPNIIEVIDVGQAEDTSLFLVMELLSGVTLETAMRRQSPPMTLSEMGFVMVAVGRALAAAHANGVIHRDLKPSNIFLHRERDGRPVPKLLDFGVSKFVEEEGGRLHARTVAGTVLGSPLYMSPEQARGEALVDGRSDVFSFGALLFEAIAGFRPYDGANFNALIVKIATQKPKDIHECAPHAPQSLRDLVQDCLETDPARRLASFDTVAERLMAALPDLEHGQFSVPAPVSGILENDPDATNALPVIRPSDKPPAHAPSYPSYHSVPPPALVPSGLHGAAGYITGPTSVPAPASIATAHAPLPVTPSPWRNPVVVMLASGVVVAVISLAAILLMSSAAQKPGGGAGNSTNVQVTGNQKATSTASSGTTTGTAPSMQMGNGSATASAPPTATVLRVDALPMASATAKPGYVSFDSQPIKCLLLIDGEQRGVTPVRQLEIAPGPHRIECRTSKGQAEVRNVTVLGGASDRHLFTFESK